MKTIGYAFILLLLVGARLSAGEITVAIVGGVADHNRPTDTGKERQIRYRLKDDATILDALVAVGGIGRAGLADRIQVKRTTRDKQESQMVNAIVSLKDPENAFKLANGDIILISQIMEDGFPAPEFFNDLLLSWGLFKAQHREPTADWKERCTYLDERSHGFAPLPGYSTRLKHEDVGDLKVSSSTPKL